MRCLENVCDGSGLIVTVDITGEHIDGCHTCLTVLPPIPPEVSERLRLAVIAEAARVQALANGGPDMGRALAYADAVATLPRRRRERNCEHGVGHSDGVHGCDSVECCRAAREGGDRP